MGPFIAWTITIIGLLVFIGIIYALGSTLSGILLTLTGARRKH